MSDPTAMRDLLLSYAAETGATIYQRGVEFHEDGTELWEFVVVARGKDVEGLNALVPVMRDRLEEDRTLDGQALDTRVAKANGPREHPDGDFFMEFTVHVLV